MSTPVKDVAPFTAACCVITGIYTDWPDCFGASGKYAITCLDIEYKCCKAGVDNVRKSIFNSISIFLTYSIIFLCFPDYLHLEQQQLQCDFTYYLR